ncbi:type II toxin-antitoxin system PemK/MazF family toxin [Altericista sp. CCNU0014]|uniref:type II toxin-antitoxin system PemK/MazF family toxin n=1 Tax=Altericista sp. CCNU0014 TaxID=3082949 RepID=UPI00384F7216
MPFNPGDIVTVDFPGVTGTKRRPAVVLSSKTYHAARPDTIVGLITTRTSGLGATDYELQDWATAGLRVASTFRSFVTLPPSANLIYIGHLSELGWKGICRSMPLK